MLKLSLTGLLFFGLVAPGPLEAQGLQPEAEVKLASLERTVLGGALGAGSAIALSSLAYHLEGGGGVCGDDPCGMVAGLTTLLVLEPILIPAGSHLANRRRGSFAGGLFASLAAGAASLWVGERLGLGEGMLILTPVVQVLTAALVERASSRGR